ncbi:MAG: sialidase, partial [Gammaproteobacteria bacterium]|nr:sialidase [Gammaproteobacteria bacterium]
MQILRASLLALAFSLTLAPGAYAAAPAKAAAAAFDSAIISGLGARNIGSATMSGRISSLDAVPMPDGKLMLWVGAASGGVWKSLDGATTFTPVFDSQPVQSIGAVEIDKRNTDTVWVGTGEAWTRNSVSIGNGIYKTTDGGDTWQHLGLEGSERIADIRIDPRASDTVYACVTGRLWSDSLERGVYRTRDGGKTWQQVLKAPSASTGCASLSMDEKNPDVLFAALWDFRRKGWTFRSGGESPTAPSASALMVTRDGGN